MFPCKNSLINIHCKKINLHCRKEREANARLGRPRLSKLLVDVEDAEDGDDESQQSDTRLRHTVRELCKTVDAFIYVVDASADSQRGSNIITAISSRICKNITAK